MSEFYLPKHVHLSAVDGAAILLDTRRGDYIGLTTEQATALGSLVWRWPIECQGRLAREIGEDVSKLAVRLLDRGLLTTDKSKGKDATPVSPESVQAPLVDMDETDRPSIAPHHGVYLVRACIRSWFSLRLLSLESVLRDVERRKASVARTSGACSLETTRELMRVFLHLRPFFYSHADRCLFDSIVLTHFLLHYGAPANLIIGVKVDPFSAHAWVQLGEYVLNGRRGYIEHFTPILSI